MGQMQLPHRQLAVQKKFLFLFFQLEKIYRKQT
jgi:hypothetical protein